MMHQALSVALSLYMCINTVNAENFHIKVKVEPNPPLPQHTTTLALGLYSFDRIEVVDWEEVQEAVNADPEDKREKYPIRTWLVSSDFNTIGYYQYEVDDFEPLQRRFNHAPEYPLHGRYFLASKIRLPLGEHPLHGSHIEQGFVIKTQQDEALPEGEEIAQVASSWLNDYPAAFSMEYTPVQQIYAAEDPTEQKRRFNERKISPISIDLGNAANPGSERGNTTANYDGVTHRFYSHRAPLPQDFADKKGNIVSGSKDVAEEEEEEMFMFELTLIKEMFYNETVNGTDITAAEEDKKKKDKKEKRKRRKQRDGEEEVEELEEEKCRHKWEPEEEIDITQCMALQTHLSSCKVCTIEEGDEICVLDMQCDSLVKLDFIDFVLTRPYVAEEFGGNWHIRRTVAMNKSLDDHVENELFVPTVINTVNVSSLGEPVEPYEARQIISNETLCPPNHDVDIRFYDNGTMTMLHKFEEDGYHQAFFRAELEDGSLIYATFGFLVPPVSREVLPLCDDDDVDDDARFQELKSRIHIPEKKGVDYQFAATVAAGTFVAVFIVSFALFALCGKSNAPKAKTE